MREPPGMYLLYMQYFLRFIKNWDKNGQPSIEIIFTFMK